VVTGNATSNAFGALSGSVPTAHNPLKAPAVHGATRRELARASLSPSARPAAPRCGPRSAAVLASSHRIERAERARSLEPVLASLAQTTAPFIPPGPQPHPPQPTRSPDGSLVPRALLSRHEGSTARATAAARPGAPSWRADGGGPGARGRRRRPRERPKGASEGSEDERSESSGDPRLRCCPGGSKGRGAVREARRRKDRNEVRTAASRATGAGRGLSRSSRPYRSPQLLGAAQRLSGCSRLLNHGQSPSTLIRQW